MAEEPQPSNVQEGASEPHAPTATAEDRKTAAALSSLDAREDEGAGRKAVDSKALGEAMKNLSVKDKASEATKAIKVEPADVTLLVSELELSKQKATDLLRANDGDAVKAMTAFVTASA